MDPTSPSTQELPAQAQRLVAALSLPEPPFEFRIGWSDGYEQLFSEDYAHVTPVLDLVDQARIRGRVLLHAEAGAGKSSVVSRLMRGLNLEERIPVLVDLRRWTPGHDESWASAAANDLLRMRVLLERLAEPSIDELAILTQSIQSMLVIVDGLNEVSSTIGNEVLVALEGFAQRNTQAGIIVTDRLVRRPLPSGEWAIATIERVGLGTAEVTEQLTPEQTEFLSKSAMFLDLALREGPDSTSSARTLRNFLVDAASLSESDLSAVSKAAFELYIHGARRTFDPSTLSASIGNEVTKALVDAGIIRCTDAQAYFRHHLFHDYLVVHS